MACGTALCNIAGLGIDPFNALCMGISQYISIPLGTLVLVFQCILAGFVYYFDRKKLGLGSLIPMLFFGYLLQFFSWWVPQFFSVPSFLGIKILLFLIGMLTIAIGMSVYMSCNLGMVPYDCFAFILRDSFQKPSFVFRMTLDITVGALAFILGGPINIGTIILAFSLGPLIDIFRKFLSPIAIGAKNLS